MSLSAIHDVACKVNIILSPVDKDLTNLTKLFINYLAIFLISFDQLITNISIDNWIKYDRKCAAFSTSRWETRSKRFKTFVLCPTLIIFLWHRAIIKTRTRSLNIHFHPNIWFHFGPVTISTGHAGKQMYPLFMTANFQLANKGTGNNACFNFVNAWKTLRQRYFAIFSRAIDQTIFILL